VAAARFALGAPAGHGEAEQAERDERARGGLRDLVAAATVSVSAAEYSSRP